MTILTLPVLSDQHSEPAMTTLLYALNSFTSEARTKLTYSIIVLKITIQ